MTDNPFLTPSELPYGLPDFAAIREEHFRPAFDQGVAEHLAEVAAIVADPEPPTFENTIAALERSGRTLNRVETVLHTLAGSDATEAVQERMRELNAELAELGTEFSRNLVQASTESALVTEDVSDLDGLDELAAVLDGSDVRIVLSGHYHHEMTGEIAGIPVHVAPGITNVVDPVGAGADERSLALSGVSLVELGEGAPHVVTSVFPNTGDTLADAERPVYRFAPEQVAQILEAAGR